MYQLPLVVSFLLITILGANAWSYKDAKNWGKTYPECYGRNQSPIILRPTAPNNSFTPPGFPFFEGRLKLNDFQKSPKKLTIRNTGRTVEMRADWTGPPPSCTGGPLHGNYVFEKATFHWDQKEWTEEATGDNWLQDALLQDMEIHLVFYKTDLKSFEKAKTQKGGLAVISMKYLSGGPDPEYLFDDLAKSLHKVRSPNSMSEVTSFCFACSIEYLSRTGPLYYYEGSLDHPPCSESVSWFIVSSHYMITESLVHELRKIKLAEGDVSNVRPPQLRHTRKVKEVFTL